jgi:hypothetical protein
MMGLFDARLTFSEQALILGQLLTIEHGASVLKLAGPLMRQRIGDLERQLERVQIHHDMTVPHIGSSVACSLRLHRIRSDGFVGARKEAKEDEFVATAYAQARRLQPGRRFVWVLWVAKVGNLRVQPLSNVVYERHDVFAVHIGAAVEYRALRHGTFSARPQQRRAPANAPNSAASAICAAVCAI